MIRILDMRIEIYFVSIQILRRSYRYGCCIYTMYCIRLRRIRSNMSTHTHTAVQVARHVLKSWTAIVCAGISPNLIRSNGIRRIDTPAISKQTAHIRFDSMYQYAYRDCVSFWTFDFDNIIQCQYRSLVFHTIYSCCSIFWSLQNEQTKKSPQHE